MRNNETIVKIIINHKDTNNESENKSWVCCVTLVVFTLRYFQGKEKYSIARIIGTTNTWKIRVN